MEDIVAQPLDWLAACCFTLLIGSLIFVLLKVFFKAIRFKTTDTVTRAIDVYSFDYSESHKLLMEREDIVQMTHQGYYDPMDQVFSLERWKQKVARYIDNYDCYKDDKK